MIVHFGASRYDMQVNIDYLRHVVNVIHDEGHTLAQDWIEPTYSLQTKNVGKKVDWGEAYQESLEAITRADVVIADSTSRSFSVGFQVATAIQLKKPTLVLHREGEADSFFARGIAIGITYAEYNDKNIDGIIKKFLQENDIQAKDMRFNFFIDRPIYNYLRWAAYRTGKTKAEILRELVSKEIEKANEITRP